MMSFAALFTNRCHWNQASFVRIGRNSPVASICMSRESRTNRSTDVLRSNRCRRSHRSECFYFHHCRCIALVDRRMHPMLKMLQRVFVNTADRLGSLEQAVHWSMSWSTSGSRPYSGRRFRRRAYWPNVVMTNNHHPSNDSAIADSVSLRRFAWNSLHMGFALHIATIPDNFWRTPEWRIQLWLDREWVDLHSVAHCPILHDVRLREPIALQHHLGSRDTVYRTYRHHHRTFVVCVVPPRLLRPLWRVLSDSDVFQCWTRSRSRTGMKPTDGMSCHHFLPIVLELINWFVQNLSHFRQCIISFQYRQCFG